MTSRVIRREFTIQTGYDTLPAVTLGYAWSSYMNTYAVWSGSSDSITITRKIELQAGYYYVTGTVDNYGSVNINGQYNINLYNFGANISRTNLGNNTRIYHPGGKMTITISAVNTGGPRGVAVTISQELVSYPFKGGSVFFIENRSVGNLVWSTRSAGTETIGRYSITMPFRANVTAHVWGGGGGGGGMDAGTIGGIGAPGLYNTTYFQIERGDSLEVFVGSGGRGGSSNSGGAPGGPAGPSRTLINGDSAKSFNGGAGTAAGPSPYSGGGGGGGGASGVLVNNVPVLVAGGGGGGGGAGNDGNGSAQYARRDASINNNAMNNKILVRSSNYNINRRDWAANYFILTGTRRNSIERGHNLAVINASTLALESYNVYDTWANPGGSGLDAALNAVGAGKIIVLFNADAGAITSTTRNILITKFGATQTATWTYTRRSHAFIGIEGASFTPIESFSDSSPVEISRPFPNVSVTEYRGENGQTKGGDGGGAGGGGGGYPGGQGGAVAGGDASGFAGECGGNFPVRTPAPGEVKELNGITYSLGGQRGGGSGSPGLVILEITPVSQGTIKIGGDWKQINQSYVKVGGNWKDINSIFVKIDGKWRTVEGAGQGDLTLNPASGDWGVSTRSYS